MWRDTRRLRTSSHLTSSRHRVGAQGSSQRHHGGLGCRNQRPVYILIFSGRVHKVVYESLACVVGAPATFLGLHCKPETGASNHLTAVPDILYYVTTIHDTKITCHQSQLYAEFCVIVSRCTLFFPTRTIQSVNVPTSGFVRPSFSAALSVPPFISLRILYGFSIVLMALV